ncbi:MAG: chromate efflux transporter [Firmicutes bacterium]|jgi:chromate transporter|nr:chromate efflux transporter [Bacillota bacterium]
MNKKKESTKIRKTFLKDVFICSLGAYGGPEAHYGVFTDQMVIKRKYLTEEEMIELIALCSILPGPTSTQTMVSMGYKTGGPILALLTMLVWALPAITIMTILSFLYMILNNLNISTDTLKFVGPMAVGFIVVAAFRIGKKVVKDKMTTVLFLFGALTTYFIRNPIIFPTVLILGGLVSILYSDEEDLWNRVDLNPPWRYLIAFSILALLAIILSLIFNNRIVDLFESFYRYGYLVFGGGQVVVPVMHSELVHVKGYMTNQEFLTGYGIVQGIPGPLFSFSAYAGGMAARGSGVIRQIIGSIVGGIGIFLPGILLIYFVYPVWENLKRIKGIKVSLKGINAVAGGLIGVSAIILMQRSGIHLENIIVTFLSIVLLLSKKVPAPLIVLLSILAGALI